MTGTPEWAAAWVPQPPHLSPYIGWWRKTNGETGPEIAAHVDAAGGATSVGAPGPDISRRAAAREIGAGGRLPLPGRCLTGGGFWPADWTPPAMVADLPDDIPQDAIIIGVIDTGVPLSHKRTQQGNATRIVSSWQQSATAAGNAGGAQTYLPFGRELYAGEINNLLTAHRYDKGGVDPDAFNRAAQLVEPDVLRGQRDLDHWAAHGAHILDAAAGCAPDGVVDQAFRDRCRIVVVNLPAQYIHGAAGNFLSLLATYAVERVIAVTDALWARNKHRYTLDTPSDGTAIREGYPLAINLSYGMQAGPMDSTLPFEDAVREMFVKRRADGAPVTMSMPAGNSNLEQCHARLTAKKTATPKVENALRWRISPSDHTPNYLELWTDPMPTDSGLSASDFRLSVSPPTAAALMPPLTPVEGAHCDLGGFARVYCSEVTTAAGEKRFRFLICVAPTLRNPGQPLGAGGELAPAGVWRVAMSCTRRAVDVNVDVQSDQSGVIYSARGLQSYLDDPNYQRYDERGGLKDSYSYPAAAGAPWLEVGEGPVMRGGTMNSLASGSDINAIAGYRRSDGKPATYSATGMVGAPYQPDVAFPTDDAPNHYGILASGSVEGSVVPFRGTSMSAALATRRIAEEMLTWKRHSIATPLHDFGAAGLAALGQAAEGARAAAYGDAAPQKIGAGRLPYPTSYLSGRVDRVTVYP